MGKCGITGETRILSQECEKAECEWKIPQFSSISSTVDANYFSPKVRIWNSIWMMRIFPNGTQKRPNWIKFELGRSNLERRVFCSLCIKRANGTEQKILDRERYNRCAYICSVRKCLPWTDKVFHRFQLPSSGTLTVKLSLYRENILYHLDSPYKMNRSKRKERGLYDWHYSRDDWDFFGEGYPHASTVRQEVAPKAKRFVSRETQTEESLDDVCRDKAKRCVSRETQTEESLDAVCRVTAGDTKGDSSLRRHLQDLLLTGDDHDVILKVKHQEFKAHKCILQSRSPVFAAMFKHKMKESEDGRIFIEDCDPNAFGDFLKYIYSENAEDLSPSKAMGLYYMADKYDFSGLKKICVEYLKASLSTTVVCDTVSMATIHGENDLLESAINFFSKHVEEIITTVEWQRFGEKNFVAANELYIKALKEKRK